MDRARRRGSPALPPRLSSMANPLGRCRHAPICRLVCETRGVVEGDHLVTADLDGIARAFYVELFQDFLALEQGSLTTDE